MKSYGKRKGVCNMKRTDLALEIQESISDNKEIHGVVLEQSENQKKTIKKTISKTKNTTPALPTNPSSSPTIAKMKSV